MAMGQGPAAAAGGLVKDTAILKLVGPTAIWAGATVGVLRTMESIVKQSGVLERGLHRIATMQGIESKFEGLLKSASLAKAKMQELNSMSMNMPFRSDEVAEAALILERLTKGAYAGAEALREVGDTAAATGNSLTDTATAVGKLMAAIESGRPLERMMFQMQQTGLMTDDLAKKLERLDSAGLLKTQGGAAIREMLKRSQGGMANDMKNLETLKMKEAEASTGFDSAFGAAFTEAKVRSYESSTRALQNMTPVMAELGREMAPIVTMTDSIKHKMVDMALGTKAAQSAAMNLIPIVKGLLTFGVAMGAGGVAGNAANFAGRLFNQRGQTKQALTAAGVAIQEERRNKARERLMHWADEAIGSSGSFSGAGMRAYGRKISNWGGSAWDALRKTHIAARARMNQTGFDTPEGGFGVGSTGIGRYAGVWARQGATATWSLAKTAGTHVLKGMASFAPYLLGAAALVGAAYLQKYANECERVVKAQLDLQAELSATAGAFEKQAKAARSAREWADALTSVGSALARVNKALSEGTNPTTGKPFEEGEYSAMASYKVRLLRVQRDMWAGRGTKNMLDEDQMSRVAEEAEIRRGLTRQEQDRVITQASGAGQQALGASLLADLESQLAVSRQQEADTMAWKGSADGLRDRALEGKLSLATRDDAGQEVYRRKLAELDAAVKLAEDRVAAEIAAQKITGGYDGETNQETRRQDLAKAGIERQDFINANTGFISSQDRTAILEEREKIAAGRGELYRLRAKHAKQGTLDREDATRLADLELQNKSSAEVQQRMLEVKNALRAGADAELISRASRGGDIGIAQARGRGERTGAAERDKEYRMLSTERSVAAGNGQSTRVAEIDAQLKTLKANEAAFSITSKLEELANGYILGGDKKGAQRVRDWQDRESLRSEFERNGMTSAQADEAFAQRLRAGAAGMLPSIQADSLQAIGGGGAFYSGADPMKSVQDRIASLSSEHVEVSRQILSAIQSTQRMQ